MKDKDNNIKCEMLLSDTPVADVFIVCHMNELSSNALKLYLWLCMTYGTKDEFTLASLNDYSYLNASEASEALAEMLEHELLYKIGSENFRLADLKQQEALEYAKSYAAKGVNIDGLELSADAKARDVLTDSISKTFYLGRCPYWCYRLVDKCLYEYNFEAPVVYKLFEEGRDGKFHVYTNRMNALAKDWYNHGYTSTNKLGEYFERKQMLSSVIEKMGKLSRRRLNGVELERIEHWVSAMDVTPELAEYAFRCNEFRGNITLKNVEDTLVIWHQAGIKSVDKAMVYENERRTERKSKARKAGGRDNVWKTGAEAGLLKKEEADSQSEKKDVQLPEDDDRSEAHDMILDLFGDNDEDN